MGCDQFGRVLGVDEPRGVSAGHLIQRGTLNLADRRPCALDGQVRVVGSEDENRGCRDRAEFCAREDTFGAWAAEPVIACISVAALLVFSGRRADKRSASISESGAAAASAGPSPWASKWR